MEGKMKSTLTEIVDGLEIHIKRLSIIKEMSGTLEAILEEHQDDLDEAIEACNKFEKELKSFLGKEPDARIQTGTSQPYTGTGHGGKDVHDVGTPRRPGSFDSGKGNSSTVTS